MEKTTPIHLNSDNLPGNQSKGAEKDLILTPTMVKKLKKAADDRTEIDKTALSNEVFGIAHSLAKDQFTLYHGSKSHVMNHFGKYLKPRVLPKGSAIVIELSPFFQKKIEAWFKTFQDYASLLYKYLVFLSRGLERVTVVTDQYFHRGLKDGLRVDRGSGTLLLFTNDSKFPSNSEKDFLGNTTNKVLLNEYLAEKLFHFTVKLTRYYV